VKTVQHGAFDYRHQGGWAMEAASAIGATETSGHFRVEKAGQELGGLAEIRPRLRVILWVPRDEIIKRLKGHSYLTFWADSLSAKSN
jgi:hypothetical protein